MNQELPDGRSNIVVLGGERFVRRAGCWTSPLPYHVGAGASRSRTIPAASPPPTESTTSSARLFTRYAALVRELSDVEPRGARPSRRAVCRSPSTSPAGIDVDAASQAAAPGRALDRAAGGGAAAGAADPDRDGRAALEVHRRAHTNGRGGTRAPTSCPASMIARAGRGARPDRRAALGPAPAGRAQDLHHGRPPDARVVSRRGGHAGRRRRGARDRAAAAPGRRAVRRPRRGHRALRAAPWPTATRCSSPSPG